MTRQKCLILGASGLVGQRLQQRLHNHPLFEITAVAGSQATAGRKLSSLEWRLEGGRPKLSDLTVLDTNAYDLIETIQRLDINIAFSALPSRLHMRLKKN